MDDLDVLLMAHDGVVSTTLAARVGVTSEDLGRWCRSRRLLRVRRGAYVDGRRFAVAHPDERYRLRVRAILATRPASDLARHHAAVALRSLPLWNVDLARVDIMADVESDFSASGVWFHPRERLVRDETTSSPAVAVARALVQVAAAGSVDTAVVAADAALARGLCQRSDLAEELLAEPRVRGHRRAARMVEMCDGRSESVGETRLRLMLVRAGLPLRCQVQDGDDEAMVARVDLLVGDRVVVEFDGAVKYAGDRSGRALFSEKRREDRIRDLGFEVVRVTWADLDEPGRVLARVRAARQRAERRRRPA
jgi:hypothetical protein